MKKTLQIDGMSCEHCVKHVTEALTALPGVVKADVKLKKLLSKYGSAVVELSEEVSDETLTAAVTEAGYTVKGIS